MVLNLRHLQLFVAVVDAGGVTKAAEQLGLAQPAASAAIRRLETDLGVALLTRSGRGAALTPQGEAFLRRARTVLAEIDGFQVEMAASQALESGRVSLGAPPMVTAHLLPGVIGDFLTAHPGIRVTLLQAGAEECAARVLRGDLDLGIVADWRTSPGLTTQLLVNNPMVACVAASSRLATKARMSWSELLKQPLILFPPGYHQRTRVDEAADRLRRWPKAVMEVESVAVMLEMVRRDIGVATLLGAAVAGADGVVALALPAEATVPVAICRRAHAPATRAVEELHSYLVCRLGDV